MLGVSLESRVSVVNILSGHLNSLHILSLGLFLNHLFGFGLLDQLSDERSGLLHLLELLGHFVLNFLFDLLLELG